MQIWKTSYPGIATKNSCIECYKKTKKNCLNRIWAKHGNKFLEIFFLIKYLIKFPASVKNFVITENILLGRLLKLILFLLNIIQIRVFNACNTCNHNVAMAIKIFKIQGYIPVDPLATKQNQVVKRQLLCLVL